MKRDRHPPRIVRAASALCLASALSACSLGYYARGAWTGLQILRTRQDLVDVALDPATDARTRGRLILAREAMRFAEDSLGFTVDGTYSTVVFLPSDTLAHVVSAAYADRLESYLWRFPIVGAVPYKGFFDLEDARREEARLAAEGLDTYLRPTGAFSTLGWLEDPIPSTLLSRDEVSLVETLFHELSHRELFVPGQVRFNESFATWVGNAAAIIFFCGRDGGGPDTVWCRRAQGRWQDAQAFSAFLDPLLAALEALYSDPALSAQQKLLAREPIFQAAFRTFDEDLQGTFRASSYAGFRNTPLNNATLLARVRYYHRLGDFAAFQAPHSAPSQSAAAGLSKASTLAEAIRTLRTEVAEVQDPFLALRRPPPTGGN